MAKKSSPTRSDQQKREVVERIVEDMRSRRLDWTRTWRLAACPRNPLSGTVYRGGNRLQLTVVAAIRGYEDPRWVTFHQAAEAGWALKKGSKSATIDRWKTFPAKEGVDDDEDGEHEVLKLVGYWSVFNASQFDNAPKLDALEAEADRCGEMADGFIASSRCPVDEGLRDEAFYVPSRDVLCMPLRGQFSSNEAFLRTLLHEMVHSTGHESALGRFGNEAPGPEDYAFEELVAELGSMFASADAGIELGSADDCVGFYDNHVAYLQHWAEMLEEDPSAIFRAAGAAQKACDYLMGNLKGAESRDVADA